VMLGNVAANAISGGDGNDAISGGGGTDSLTGGNGADQFSFGALTDSPVGAGRDIITDFVSGTDRIGLSGIDASTAVAGNQAFTLINTAAFSAVAGQLRYEVTGGNTILEGDVDGNGTADFQIELTGVHSFVAADLIL
jgi:Ca2+-binding RTX toxin-like protein